MVELDAIETGLATLRENVYSSAMPLDGWSVQYANHTEPGNYDMLTDVKPAPLGEELEAPGDTAFLTNSFTLPASYTGRKVYLEVDVGREAALFLDGVPYHGLDRNRDRVLLASSYGGETYDATIEANTYLHEASEHLAPRITKSAIVTVRGEVEGLYHDVRAIADAGRASREPALVGEFTRIAGEALGRFDAARPDESAQEARAYLWAEVGKLEADGEGVAHLIGHSHIDVAWKWPLAETVRKTSRTFSTATTLMDEYPEYVFTQSQPQLYQYAKEHYPELYGKIKQRVKEGRWEVTGGMWVEPDCNLISGESFVRQFLHGQRFFEKEFGKRTRVCWLPDAFGYAAAMPQIMKKAGVDYFHTCKMNWNDTNKFPHNTFMWQGLDGTQVLSYMASPPNYNGQRREFAPYSDYNGSTDPRWIEAFHDAHQDKDVFDEVMPTYGFGDGGGGVTREMLEMGRRTRNLPGMVEQRLSTVDGFFDRVRDNAVDLPVWKGELYLEYHRGTYTTQARTKQNNRQCEVLLRDAEVTSSLAGLYEMQDLAGMHEAWGKLLLNQFHDILPGSSIREVYDDAERDYAQVRRTANRVRSDALDTLADRVELDAPSVVVFNTLSFARSDVVTADVDMDGPFQLLDDGRPVAHRVIEEDGVRRVVFTATDVPSFGHKAYEIRTVDGGDSDEDVPDEDVRSLENEHFRLSFDDHGDITQIYDKANDRQVLKPGERGNVFEVYQDEPKHYPAWNIDREDLETGVDVDDLRSIRLVEDNGVRKVVEVQKAYNDSTFTQRIALYADIPRIDFQTDVDWHEDRRLLKVRFPVDVLADDVTYDEAYGNVQRSNHDNTSFDEARYEVPAHKWADVSEPNYGVALLNDCKYGHSVKDSDMRLTLLRAPVFPDPQADRGHHEFTYSLYPHAGDWRQGDVALQATSLNTPLSAVVREPQEGTLPGEYGFLDIDRDNVMIEVVKKAEDSDDLIVRLNEYHGRRDRATVRLAFDVEHIVECNLLEDEEMAGDVPVHVDGGNSSFSFEIKPYEIRTFKVRPKRQG